MKEAHKHRLIGAAILAAVAILFLPSFLKDNQHYSVDSATQLPARPSITAVSFNDPEAPEVEPAINPDRMFIEGEPVALSESIPPSPEMPSQELSATETAESISSAAVSSSAPAAPVISLEKGVVGGYTVRIVSLSSKESAYNLEKKLLGLGYKAYVRSAVIPGGMTYRVFAGPVLDMQSAALLKQQLDKEVKVSSIVQKFEP